MADTRKPVAKSSLSTFIESHPLSVLVSVAVGAFLLGGGAASWIMFNGYVPNQLYTLQTQLDDCRRQTRSTATQSTIGGKAEDAVSDEWTPLNAEQIALWVTRLSPYHVKTVTVYWSQEVDARKFFRSLQAVGKQLNCEVKAGQGQADGHEIEIIANKNDPAGAAMLDLFKSLNWPASLEQSGGQKGEIQVFIPQKSP